MTCCATRRRTSRRSWTSRYRAHCATRWTSRLPPRKGPRSWRSTSPADGSRCSRDPACCGTARSPACREFAAAAHVGVANTWGAKGVFNWDSPHHLGTCGLQADDFALLGFADLDLLWVAGLDPDESPAERYEFGARVVTLRPTDLAALATGIARSSYPIEPPPLFERIAAVAQPGYVDDRVPRHPARAVMDLKQRTPAGGIITAAPGPAGLWFARTFPTDAPGTIVVPARATPGIAVACALAAARAGRPATAVAVEPLDDVSQALVELGARLSAPLTVELWGDDVDLSLTGLLVDAAGPVVAWTGR